MRDQTRHVRSGAKQASMADVAEAAGVSMITVSRMLRSPNQVAAQTRARIEAAMSEVGYVPNLIAGGLAATRTQLVAAIVPYIQHGVFADSVQGLSDSLTPKNYCVLLGNSGGSVDEEETIVRTLLGHRPAGLVIQGANHSVKTRQLLSKAQIPVVEMGTLPDEPINMSVGYSNEAAALAIVQHFISCGRRRIGFIGHASETNDRHQRRLRGYMRGLSEAGLAYEETLLETAEFTIEAGSKAFVRLRERCPDLDAIFSSSDLWAAGAVFECQRLGIPVPSDISICGFNDQELASQMVPALTTIQVRRHLIGEIAGDLILKSIAGEEPSSRHVDVGFDLIIRETTVPYM